MLSNLGTYLCGIAIDGLTAGDDEVVVQSAERTGKRLGRRVTEIALVFKRAPHLPKDALLLVNLSGRGDKDMENIIGYKKEHAQ